VPAWLPEDLGEQLRGGIRDHMLLGKRRVAGDEDRQLHNPPYAAELPQRRFQLRHDVDRALAGALLGDIPAISYLHASPFFLESVGQEGVL
jgi:hypothetical protein